MRELKLIFVHTIAVVNSQSGSWEVGSGVRERLEREIWEGLQATGVVRWGPSTDVDLPSLGMRAWVPSPREPDESYAFRKGGLERAPATHLPGPPA